MALIHLIRDIEPYLPICWEGETKDQAVMVHTNIKVVNCKDCLAIVRDLRAHYSREDYQPYGPKRVPPSDAV